MVEQQNTSFPEQMKVKVLDEKHPDYVTYSEAWDDISALFTGGAILKKRAQDFLVKRGKELAEVYARRTQEMTYENVIGPGIGWYITSMFSDPPEIDINGASAADNDPNDFYSAFLLNCNRGGQSYIEFWRGVLQSLLCFGAAYVLEDLPNTGDPIQYASAKDQKEVGALDAYLVLYDPRQVIGWEADDAGNLEWIKLYIYSERYEFGKPKVCVNRWYYYDRQNYAIYEAISEDDRNEITTENPNAIDLSGADKPEMAKLVDQGRHAMADQNRVPFRRFALSDVLWLGNRVYLPSQARFNLENRHLFSLGMSNLPMMWVKGGFKTPPTMSDTAYFDLEDQGEVGYLETSGVAYEITAKTLSSMREEIYRQLYLQSQGKDSSAVASASSGRSKEMDKKTGLEVRNGLADIIREGMRQVLEDVALIRGDNTNTFTVRGMDAEDDDTDEEIATVSLARQEEIQSDSFDKWLQKKLVRKMASKERPEIIQSFEDEIQAAPTKTQIAAQQQADLQNRMDSALQTANSKFEMKVDGSNL